MSEGRLNAMFHLGGVILALLTVSSVFTVPYYIFSLPTEE